MSDIKALDKLRELAADINASEIVGHMELYPSCVFDGAWLDAWQADFYRTIDDLESEIAERFMELPLDADGVPWHMGDEVRRTVQKDRPNIVTGIYLYADGMHRLHVSETECTAWTPHASEYRHVKSRAVEDVLGEFVNEYNSSPDGGTLESLTAKYAAEIRELLRGDAE